MRITPSTYKELQAVTLENDRLQVQFLPGCGAKMSSLVYKPADLELLVQRPDPTYGLQPYDGDYVAGECSGFDDMFPTIDECFYERYPWQGTRIPDHGEVWSLPWALSSSAEGLHFSVHGIRFPYRLEKRVRLAGETTLRIDYRATNLCGFDLDFLWAAHIMLNLEEGSELSLPPGTDRIVNTFSYSGLLGQYGDEAAWPMVTSRDGRKVDLRKLRPKTVADAAKYWVKGALPEGWCELSYPQSRVRLRLSFPVEQVPYLGILPNEGTSQDLYSIFLEPATGTFDRIDVARLRGECSTLPGNGSYVWYLEIVLDDL